MPVNFALIIEPLGGSHDRKAFTCGVSALDCYIREQATQDVKRRVGSCFVALDRDIGAIAGYCTLAALSVPIASLPEDLTKRLLRHPVLPAILIGRPAVDTRYQGRRVGSALIVDALQTQRPGRLVILVEAKDDQAAAF